MRSYLVPINLNQNELQNARVQNLGTAPASPVAGQVYYLTTSNGTQIWNGTGWRPTDAALLTDGSIQNTALLTNPLARANHTGTQVSATISDLATTVASYRLSVFAVPNANIALGGFKFTGAAAPSAPGDVAEYSWTIGQVQSAAAGIASKPPVVAVSTTNNTLSGLTAVDGYTPLANDRILVVGQTTASANGVYNASAGAWTRTTVDGAAPGEIETGAMWLVTGGTTYAGTQWRVSTVGPLTVGTTSLSIVQFGAASVYAAGNGITLTGSTFAANPVAGGGILVAAGGISVDPAVVVRKYATTIGDGSTTSFVVTHNLNTQDVTITVRSAGTPFGLVETDTFATSTTTATVTFASAPAASAYRVVIVG